MYPDFVNDTTPEYPDIIVTDQLPAGIENSKGDSTSIAGPEWDNCSTQRGLVDMKGSPGQDYKFESEILYGQQTWQPDDQLSGSVVLIAIW